MEAATRCLRCAHMFHRERHEILGIARRAATPLPAALLYLLPKNFHR
jgi:hypothetical protein